ncbi:hypothetical protein ACOMHN_012051 [Nucella lapillus]
MDSDKQNLVNGEESSLVNHDTAPAAHSGKDQTLGATEHDKTPPPRSLSVVLPADDTPASGDGSPSSDGNRASTDKKSTDGDVKSAEDVTVGAKAHGVHVYEEPPPHGADCHSAQDGVGVADSSGLPDGEAQNRGVCEEVGDNSGRAAEADRLGVEDDNEEGGRDTEKERTQLLSNGRTAPQEVEDEEERTDDDMKTTSADHRVQSLSQGILDLEARSELGTDVVFAPYVRRRRPGKYVESLKSLLPVRAKVAKDILPVSSSGCLNMLTYGWVTPIIINIYRKGAETLKTFRLCQIDSAETQAVSFLWYQPAPCLQQLYPSFFSPALSHPLHYSSPPPPAPVPSVYPLRHYPPPLPSPPSSNLPMRYSRDQLLEIQPSTPNFELVNRLRELRLGVGLPRKRGCRGGRKKLRSIQVVPSRNLHPLMVPPFLQPHPDLQSAVGNAPLSSKHPTHLPTTDCLLSITPLMGGQPSDAPALSPPSPLQQGGQSSNAPALSPPSLLPQGSQPIALVLSPSSPLPQDGQPSDAPGLSPSSSTLLLCPSDSTLSICHLNSQSAVKTAMLGVFRLEHFWKEEVEKRGREKASFQRVVLRAFRTRLILTLIFLVLFVFFSLLNPIFLIRTFLEYLSEGEVDVGVGMAYVAGMVLCELLRSLCMGQAWMNNYIAGMRIRAGAVTLLFKKILSLKGLKDKTVGELVNLVGNDSQRIFEALAIGPLVLAGPVAMAAGSIYAVFYLGPLALVGCMVFVGFYPFNTFVSKLTSYFRSNGIIITDKRVRMMNELLSCIKLIKMYAWEKPFARKIAAIRLEERRLLEKSAMVQSISTGTAIIVPTIASALTFIAIISCGNNLTAAEAFSFVALLNSMRFVLGVLPYGVKSISEVTISLKRFTSILLMEEMADPSEGGRPPDGMALEVKDANLTWSTGELGSLEMSEGRKKPGESRSKKGGSKVSTSHREKEEEEQDMLNDSATNNLMARSSTEAPPAAVLSNITFSLKKNQLLGVCGSVGSGKSSLIQAILGRMERMSGSVAVTGSVAYVPQQAWIMNATARDNILFSSPYHQQRYNKVVEACALQSDFDSMLSGDLTEIGERGINLSGGQKQRISMARALYSDRDLYLLDDPLSAVDIHVGRHIFSNCISGFLAGKARVFVTHQLQYLPLCDSILFLKDGQVLEKGHHSELMDLGGEYSAVMRMYYNEHITELEENSRDEIGADVELSSSARQTERALSSSSGMSSSLDARNLVIIERATSHSSKGSKAEDMEILGDKGGAGDGVDKGGAGDGVDKGKGRLISEEEAGKGSVGLGVFLAYMRAGGGSCVSFLVFLIFLVSVTCQNFAVFFLSFWLGQGSGNTTVAVGNVTVVSHSVTDHPLRMTFTLIYGMTLVAIIVFLVIRAVCFMKYTLRAASAMHDDVFEKVLRCPMSFFDTTPLGRIVNRFSSDMDEVDVRLPMTFEVFVCNVLHILFSMGLISYVAPWFLIALLPLVVTFFIMFFVFKGTIRDIKRQDMVSRAPLLSHITTSVQGIATIHAYSKSNHFLSKFCGMLNKNSVPFAMFFISNRWLALRLDLLCVVIIGVTSLIILFTKEHITPAMAGLALSSAIQMTGLFQFTVRLATEAESRFTSVQRVLDYSKTIEPEAASVIPGKRPKDDWPKNGAVVFRNVQLRYRPELPLVLKGVSFKVSPQEKIGIVGRTGSGKSSLGVALFRLVELSGGSIKIDDLDTGSMGLEDLRSKLSIIPQDPVLFVGTVRYNLDPLNHHGDDQLWVALEKCHIKDSIAGLDQQLEAPVVENGENFSVGERQLLCMARALLRHSKILIMDEATAAIDTETDALVQATLKEAFWDCTMLIIAHRLNTVLSCDKILVMDDGKVMEYDRPTTLLSKSSSLFRNMLQASENTFTDA